MATNFFGIRGTGDFVTDARPKSWRETLLYIDPTGDASLTGLLSKMSKEKVDDAEFNWWTQTYRNSGGAVTGIYKSPDLSTGTGLSSVTAGNIFYVKCSAETESFFRPGHQAWVINSSDLSENFNAIVTAVESNGASSYVAVRALQASTGDPDSAFDRIMVVGNINAEGGTMPSPITTDPEKWYNYTQIFRNSLSMTRTALRTKLKTPEQYQKAKMECLKTHGCEMEKAFLFGYPTEATGDNGMPMRTTMGLVTAIRGIDHGTFGGYPDVYSSYSGLVSHFPTAYAGSTWLDKGEEWLDTQFSTLFKYGGPTRLAYCGNGVLLGINSIVKYYGNYQFTPQTTAYGIKVMTLVTPFGEVMFQRHPLFNLETSLANSAVLFEPNNLIFKYIDDTTFFAEGEKQNTGLGRIDGINEEFLTEAGLEIHNVIGCAFLSGFNTNG